MAIPFCLNGGHDTDWVNGCVYCIGAQNVREAIAEHYATTGCGTYPICMARHPDAVEVDRLPRVPAASGPPRRLSPTRLLVQVSATGLDGIIGEPVAEIAEGHPSYAAWAEFLDCADE